MKAEGWAKAMLPTLFGHRFNNCVWHSFMWTCGTWDDSFQLNFVYGVKEGSLFILFSQCEYPFVSSSICWKDIPFSIKLHWYFFEYQLTLFVNSVLYSLHHYYSLLILVRNRIGSRYISLERLGVLLTTSLLIHGHGLLLLFRYLIVFSNILQSPLFTCCNILY